MPGALLSSGPAGRAADRPSPVRRVSIGGRRRSNPGESIMALPNVPHRIGRVESGDVSIFYRAFGTRGATPIVVMHGANYFDSYDWIGVAGALAGDREVVAFDRRGWGESSWSPSKDYSLDAHVGDAMAVVNHMGWSQVIFMGHSASGRVVVSAAANFPDKAAKLMVLDSPLGGEFGDPNRPKIGNPPTMYESVETMMAGFAKASSPPRVGSDRERALHALIRLEKGYMLKRDPDNGNTTPQGEAARLPRREPRDVWQDLAAVKCPTMLVHALRSDRLDPKTLGRIAADFKTIAVTEVDCRHDIPNEQPEALIAHVRKFRG
jgi:pimeloyl-ACP methyl ester carboxylesterase